VTIIQLLHRAALPQGFRALHARLQYRSLHDAEALERAITPNTAAFIVEPYQAEAGILMPSRAT